MVREPPVRRDRPSLLPPPGGRAAGHDSRRLHRCATGSRGVLRAVAGAVPTAQADHDLRSLFAGPGGHDETDGDGRHLPGRLGDVRPGITLRGSGPGLGELSPQSGARRSSRAGAGTAHSRQKPTLRPHADERRRAQGDPGHRLSALHHCRRRHRSRWGRACAQSDPPPRRGRAAGLPHRRPEAWSEEVRPPERQGARGRGRADQAPQRRPPAARHHARSGHPCGPNRRRVCNLPRESKRRARSALHPRRHQHRPAKL